MTMTDPIADMATRIRNAHKARHEKVEVPASKLKLEIVRVLKAEGYIKNYKLIQDKRQGVLRIFLKYDADRQPVIQGIQRLSVPGRRRYAGAFDLPSIKQGLGIAVVTTSKGVMTDREARREHVGGEPLIAVW